MPRQSSSAGHPPAPFLRRSAITALILLALVGGCGGDPSPASAPPAAPGPVVPDPTAPAAQPAADVAYLDAYLRNWYFWRDRLPVLNLTGFADAAEALTALKVPEDRYSYIDDALSFNQFFDEGKTLGYGIGYAVRGDAVWIRLVQPRSPAATAGLRRGDRLLAIDDVPVETLIAEDRLDAAFGPIESGIIGRFSVLRDGQAVPLQIIKQPYVLASVLASRVLPSNGRKVGYISLYTFNAPSRAAWFDAIDEMVAGGAQDLVVDLRDNGGGLLSLTADIASSLAPADAPGKLFIRSEYNSNHRSSDFSYRLSTLPGLGRFERIVWLTSERTCSASEALIVGLRPYRQTSIVGDTTCGKPVGFNPEQRQGKVYSIVTFRLLSASGETDYFDGLTPDCRAIDDFSRPYGDPEEVLLAQALQVLAGKPCLQAPVVPKQRRVPIAQPGSLISQVGVK